MNFLGKMGDQSETVVVFHIGSAMVEAGILFSEKGGEKIVHYAARAQFPFYKDVDSERFQRAMLSALLEVGMQAQTEGGKRLREAFGHARPPREAYCLYSSPWYVAQLRNVTISREKEVTPDEKLLAATTESEQKRFTESLQKLQIAGFDDVSILDMEPLEITLNGYSVPSPIGRTAQSARISYFASAVPKTVHAQVSDVIHRVFPDVRIEAHASVLPQLAAVLAAPERAERFLLIEIGGEVTEVSLVRGRILEDTSSFPIGANHIARRIGGSTDNVAQARAALHAKKKSGGRAEDVAVRQDEALIEWRKGFLETCEELGDGSALPRQAVVLAEDELGYEFKKTLARTTAKEYTFSPDPFVVLDHGEVNGLETYANDGVAASERLLIDTYFVNRQAHDMPERA